MAPNVVLNRNFRKLFFNISGFLRNNFNTGRTFVFSKRSIGSTVSYDAPIHPQTDTFVRIDCIRRNCVTNQTSTLTPSPSVIYVCPSAWRYAPYVIRSSTYLVHYNRIYIVWPINIWSRFVCINYIDILRVCWVWNALCK